MNTRILITVLAIASTQLTGQDGRQLFQRNGAGFFGSGGYADSIAVVGDVNGDGVDDIAACDPSHFYSGGPTGTGIVEVLSGVDGSVLRVLQASNSDFQLGNAVAATGDVNGDLVPDVLATSSNAVILYSGSDGSILNRVTIVPTALAGPGDWNNDLVPDLAWVQNGSLEIVSGATGTSITSLGSTIGTGEHTVAAIASNSSGAKRVAILEPTGITVFDNISGVAWTRLGYQTVADAGLFDGDQFGDVVAIVSGGATAQVLSGFDGSVILTVPGGTCASAGVDLNGDGFRDVVVGDPSGTAAGVARAYSGQNSSLLLERIGQEANEDMGSSVAMLPAFSGSGGTRPAMLVGARNKFNGSQTAGSLLAIAEPLPGEFDGSFRTFGQICNFTFTRMRPGSLLPTIGSTYTFRFDNNTSVQGFEFLVWGFSKTSWNGAALPLTLPSIQPCQLYVSVDATVFPAFSSFASISIPLTPGLVGAELHAQGISALGFPVIESSNAGTMTIGN